MCKDAGYALYFVVGIMLMCLTSGSLASSTGTQIIAEQQQNLQPYPGVQYFCASEEDVPDITGIRMGS